MDPTYVTELRCQKVSLVWVWASLMGDHLADLELFVFFTVELELLTSNFDSNDIVPLIKCYMNNYLNALNN